MPRGQFPHVSLRYSVEMRGHLRARTAQTRQRDGRAREHDFQTMSHRCPVDPVQIVCRRGSVEIDQLPLPHWRDSRFKPVIEDRAGSRLLNDRRPVGKSSLNSLRVKEGQCSN